MGVRFHFRESFTGASGDFRLDRHDHFSAFYQVALAASYRCLDLRPGDRVLDAGAHIGIFTVLAARSVGPRGCVIAVEPSAENLAQLRTNIALNGLGNVQVVHAGLWSSDAGELAVQEHGTMTTVSPASPSSPAAVRTTTPGALLSQFELDQFDVVKMDIEGAEEEVFRGASAERLMEARSIALELHGVRPIAEIPPILSARGFHEAYSKRGSEDFIGLAVNSLTHPLLLARLEATNRWGSIRRIFRDEAGAIAGRSSGRPVLTAIFERAAG